MSRAIARSVLWTALSFASVACSEAARRGGHCLFHQVPHDLARPAGRATLLVATRGVSRPGLHEIRQCASGCKR